jgi:lipopolysaccharide transport system permease protein
MTSSARDEPATRHRRRPKWPGPLSPFVALRQNYELVFRMARRELISKYRGSILGLAWAFLLPIAMVLIYTFVFSVVFKARWPGLGDGSSNFALFALSGLVLHQYFAECVARAPGLVLENKSYVTRVIFPLEILPWVTVLSSLLGAVIGVTLILLFRIVAEGFPSLGILLLPLPFLLLLPMILGLVWGLAALGVFIRDLSQAVPLVLQAMLFLGPILYPIEAVPSPFDRFLYLNPITIPVELFRALLFDRPIEVVALFFYSFSSIFVCWLGFASFTRLKRTFPDVL